jgi:disulfide oxidoreductase YuzD
LGKNIVYDDMIHWLKDSIEFFMNQPEKQLVVRTHPGEGHLAAYASGCESVAELLNRQYPNLPNNIKIVSGKEEISSHQLAEMAKTIVVYTTSVGLEMALRGRRVLVVGKSHYRNKGFTVDLETKDEYYKEIMNQDQNDSKTSEEQIKLANKYAYYFIVRTETYLDEFNIEDRHQYQIIDPEHFLPGKSVRWDNLCNNLENQGDYVDCTGYIK